MTEELKKKLQQLAEKYETEDFCKEDPSQFIRWYDLSENSIADVEVGSFITAMLSFGSRKQFIPKIQSIMELADRECNCISKWILNDTFRKSFPTGEKKFYRFYSYNDMQIFFGEIQTVLKKYGTLGEAVKNNVKETENGFLKVCEAFGELFKNSKIVPKGKNSANKRIHMFLRWMVRDSSPVDIGIWNWISKNSLLIPLDVHVMEEGIKLGLLPSNAKASYKTAVQLTNQLKLVFPDDPVKGDFALFGLGVDE